jgi:FkbM family methyltransferase
MMDSMTTPEDGPVSGATAARSLPPILRAWAATRRVGHFRGQARIAVTLAERLLDGDAPYRGADGVVLRIDPRDDYQVLMLLGLYDRGALEALRTYCRPGSIVIDAGAHIGYFSVEAARRVGGGGEVHAFECDPRVAERLREHAALNAPDTIVARELALADEPGELRLSMPGQFALSSLHSSLHDDAEQVAVTALTLDAYLDEQGVDARRVSFIKVDVEGAELTALSGMRETLRRSGAAVLVEVDPDRALSVGEDPEALFALFESVGYEARHVYSPRGGPATLADLRRGGGGGVGDVLFVPGKVTAPQAVASRS